MRLLRVAIALPLCCALGLGCTSTAARQARQLYDRGDYAGAAKSADAGLAEHGSDSALWQVRIRALLAQGDARGVAAAYERYRATRGGDDAELVKDMAIATLGQALKSTSLDVKVQAIGYVEDLMLMPLAEDVMDLMAHDDDRVAAAAAVAVLNGHPQAPYLLEQLQRSDDPAARALAIEGIGRKVGKHAADDLRQAAADPDARVRIAAMGALAGLSDETTTRALAEAQRDAEPSVRAAAARSLAARKQGDLVGFARVALADAALSVRLVGVALLATAKDQAALLDLTGGEDVGVAIAAAAALHGADPAAATRAPATASPERPDDGSAGTASAVRAIDAGLASALAVDRIAALNVAEAALGSAAALERGRAKLADPDVTVRVAAARLVGYLGAATDAIPVLAAALDGPERLSAAADLVLLGDDRGVTVLSSALLDAKRPDARLRAVSMHLTARRITPGLVAALADPNGQVRGVAAYTLIKLARTPD
jgi:HEAT repeat protein